jgi:hypothetical protein
VERLILWIVLANLTGCAGAVVNTDPAAQVRYSGLASHSVEADVHGDSQRVTQVAQQILAQYGYQIISPSDGNALEATSAISKVSLKISSSGSDSHVEMVAMTGSSCWNQDHAGQLLSQIVLAK